MIDQNLLAKEFEENRDHLTAVAYRMLGSATEADDAVQDAWLRLTRSDADEVDNLRAWLTTVTARLCLDRLRSRQRRREDPIDDQPNDPPATAGPTLDPAYEAELADSVGLALMVVLDTLGPAERLAFVLHDLFGVPFEEIAPMVGRTETASRQLASRARRRVRGAPAVSGAELARQREVVEAFLAAARDGDFEALVAVLDPDVVLRADGPGAPRVVHGAEAVASGARSYARRAAYTRTALVDGAVGTVQAPNGHLTGVARFTVVDGAITEIDITTHLDALADVEVAVLDT